MSHSTHNTSFPAIDGTGNYNQTQARENTKHKINPNTNWSQMRKRCKLEQLLDPKGLRMTFCIRVVGTQWTFNRNNIMCLAGLVKVRRIVLEKYHQNGFL